MFLDCLLIVATGLIFGTGQVFWFVVGLISGYWFHRNLR